jgi:uncharacterized protein
VKRLWPLLLLVWLLLPSASALAEDYPAPSGYVVDEAGVIPASVERTLELELADYDRRSGNQVAICVIRSLDGLPVEDYANSLFNQWGVGQAGKDNGVLLLLSIDDHADRIEVGNGLADVLTDGRASEILGGEVLASARARNYAGAVQKGERAIRLALGDTAAAVASGVPGSQDPFNGGTAEQDAPAFQDQPSGDLPASSGGGGGFTGFAIAPGIFVLFAILTVISRFFGGGGGSGFTGSRGIGTPMSRGYSFGSSTSGGMGGGGGGGSGGGGFGGGHSSGGGASGGW